MFKFLEVEAGKRPVIYHGETAYWVVCYLSPPLFCISEQFRFNDFFPLKNYDIDVPLFLPIYAESRLSDLRAIAADQLNVSISLIVTFLRKNLKSFCFEIQGSARH